MFWNYLEKPIWNNKISYEERKKLWSECKLYVSWLQDLTGLQDINNNLKDFLNNNLKLWDKIVFEEVLDWKLYSKTWLENYLVFNYKNSKICVFDNHNIAFYFVWQYFLETWKKLDLVHIDQHSDMYEEDIDFNEYRKNLDLEEAILKYTFEWVNVGNYLLPLQKAWFINQIYQKRTEIWVLELEDNLVENSILNIDLDFWEENIATTKESLEKIKKYIWKSPLVLIATSPYFIDQKRVVDIIYNLFN